MPTHPRLESQSPDQHEHDLDPERHIPNEGHVSDISGFHGMHLIVLNQSRNTLHSPVYKLPDDLLADIFVAGAMTPGEFHSTIDVDLSFRMSWVASRWRRVALSTTALWTSIELQIPMTRGTDERWATLLSRTRTSSRLFDVWITLSVNEVIGPVFFSEHQALQICETLTRSKRLFTASASQSAYVGIGPFSNVVQPCSLLAELSLSLIRFRTLSDLLDLLQSFPGLVRLTLDNVIHRVSPTENRTVNFERLVELTLRGGFVDDDLHTYSVPPQVRIPRMKDLSLYGLNRAVGKGVDLSSVAKLFLHASYLPSHATLINLLCCMPALEILMLDAVMYESTPTFPSEITLPPLVRIDFCRSMRMDSLARWLVERLATNHFGGTLKTVSATTSDVETRCAISPITQQWIQEQGIQFILRSPERMGGLMYDH